MRRRKIINKIRSIRCPNNLTEMFRTHLRISKEVPLKETKTKSKVNLKALKIRLAVSVDAMMIISMRNLLIFIIGKTVLCLLNAGNADRLLKFQALMSIFCKNVSRALNTSFVLNAKGSLEWRTLNHMIV